MIPTVSIIVNCYNQGHYLARSVNSVLTQTFTDLECIIVDDGSTDNTRQVAEELMAGDGRVRYYYKENGGLPAARNFGVAAARGDWIQCLDADDWIDPDKIKFQLEMVKSLENVTNIVLYCDYERVFFDENDAVTDRQQNAIGAMTSPELIRRLLWPDFLANTPHPALQQCMLMHRSVLEKSRFPEEMKALGDRYFALDILGKGAKFIYAPIIGAFYTKHKSNRTNSWQYMKNYYLLFYEKVHREQPDLRHQCDIGLEYLMNEAIRDREAENFHRLLAITETPVNLAIWDKNLKIKGAAFLKLAYKIRNLIPSFILYEKYRGPRSKKILSLLGIPW
ncbi:glycosyltransferase family 2 protein [[Phormidium] sp. ETS-05]|uniref:glycosyltransferase family 2 protein n=1 Tax=[Phormidium] sp. ETS-05 TaxID=222819 RepID=UPI0018EF0FDF|nr:glycosyltransferase family 2 protein [[Phormidium] sp. ETS-05]